ncbi:MAG TPA: hypothetical protein VMY43_12120 [Methanothrix sp.]|nr:hypothetical protein [Methanothrix sp.]
MFLLGEYYEDEARDIADRLKHVGMKVDIRTFTASRLELFHYLEGRMSVLKGKLEETDYARYERYIIAMRKVLAEGAGAEDFGEKFHLELDPQMKEKRKQFAEILRSDLSEEEREARKRDSAGIKADLLDLYYAESFVDTVLDRNDIEIGDDVGSKLDDPILRVIDDGVDLEEESELARTTTVFTIEPRTQVFVDEFYAVLAEELDEEFEDEYEKEYMRLVFLGKLITDLKEPSSGKIDMEAFRERCEFEMEKSGDLLEIDGSRAAEELARSLEKNGIIKVKGGSVKWKR